MYLQKQTYLQNILMGTDDGGRHVKSRMTFIISGYLPVSNHGIRCAVRKAICKDKGENLRS